MLDKMFNIKLTDDSTISLFDLVLVSGPKTLSKKASGSKLSSENARFCVVMAESTYWSKSIPGSELLAIRLTNCESLQLPN